jgi:hypothetical protein
MKSINQITVSIVAHLGAIPDAPPAEKVSLRCLRRQSSDVFAAVTS